MSNHHIPQKIIDQRMKLQLEAIESPSDLPGRKLCLVDSDKKSGFQNVLRENKLKLMFDSPNLTNKRLPSGSLVSPVTDLAFNLNDTSLNSPAPASVQKKLTMDNMESSPSPCSSLSSDSSTPLGPITNKPKGRFGRMFGRRNTEPINYSDSNKENIPLPFQKTHSSPLKSCSPLKHDSPLALKDNKYQRVIQSPEPVKSLSSKTAAQKRTYFKVLNEEDENSRDSGYSSQPAEDARARKKSRQELIQPTMDDFHDIYKDISPSKETDGFAPLSASPSSKSSKSTLDGFDPDTLELDTVEEEEDEDGGNANKFTALLDNKILVTRSDDNILRRPSKSSPTKSNPSFRRALSHFDPPGHSIMDADSPISRNSNFKRPDLPAGGHSDFCITSSRKKRQATGVERSASLQYHGTQPPRPTLQRSQSEMGISKCAAEFKDDNPDVLPDSYGKYCLPSETGKSRNHPNLRSITCHTLADLMGGKFDNCVKSYRIIDVRYQFEYEGGHIRGAENWQHGEDEKFLSAILPEEPLTSAPVPDTEKNEKRNILIFHCEFSSQRAPDFYMKLRERDRTLHANVYPALHYPECYLLHLGYKEFYSNYPELCNGQYTEMTHKDFSHELRKMRSKSKSWSGGTVARTNTLSRKF